MFRISHLTVNMYLSFGWQVVVILILVNHTQMIETFDVLRFFPILDFTKTGTFRKLDANAVSSSQAGCAGSCASDRGSCIGFAYSKDLKKCVKSYTVGDLDDLSDGHWRTFYGKCIPILLY